MNAAFRAITAAALLVLAAPSAGRADWQRFQQTQQHMGTYFTITVYAQDADLAMRAMESAFGRIQELDQLLSNYKPDSEVNLLSDASPHESPVPVSVDVWNVLERSAYYHRLSDGDFDVTIGPLTKLWRRARRTHEIPAQHQRDEAMQRVGQQHLRLDPTQRTVQMTRQRMLLDLGGIGKGFALDEALRTLERHGVPHALVDGGGDVAAGKPPVGRASWTIQIADVRDGSPEGVSLSLFDRAVATSGDIFQYVELDGVRYSHLVNPHTGLGLTQRSSVTVIAPDGTAADALASAVSVMGRERGLQLITSLPDTEARIAQIEGQEVRVSQSAGFHAFVVESEERAPEGSVKPSASPCE